MKFLCIECDQAMKLQHTTQKDGSISALFSCPECGRGIAMLTNPWETEVVQSLGVKLGKGGGAVEAAGKGHTGVPAAASESAEPMAGGCPFSGMVQESPAQEGIPWTPGALERLERVPEFVRPMARQGIEHYARSQGRPVVDEETLAEARGRFGM
jgi:hypothetical protein